MTVLQDLQKCFIQTNAHLSVEINLKIASDLGPLMFVHLAVTVLTYSMTLSLTKLYCEELDQGQLELKL